MNNKDIEQIEKPYRKRKDLVYSALLFALFVGIGIYSQDIGEAISALCMILLVIGHFRTRRKTREGEKFGTPESTALVSMALGVLLIVAIIFAWTYAIERGGLWWILFSIVGFACLRAGEALKKGLEGAVKDSRDERKQRITSQSTQRR